MNIAKKIIILLSFMILTIYSNLMVDYDPVLELEKTLKISLFPINPKFQLGEDVLLQVSIQNTSINKLIKFNAFDNPFIQFSFKVEKNNQDYPHKNLEYYIFMLNNNVFEQKHKVIELGHTEKFSKTIHLNDFIEFNYDGIYEISGNFYPMGIAYSNYSIPIQPFEIRLHPQKNFNQASTMDSIASIKKKPSSQKPISLSKMFPNEVLVDYFEKIKYSQFDGYLDHLWLEKLLGNAYSATEIYQRFKGAKMQDKNFILTDFKNFLIRNLDYELVDYKILKTLVIDDTAKVEVIIAKREAYENFDNVINLQTGEIETTWLKNINKKLIQYFYTTFDLENFDQGNRRQWKITGYDTRVLDRESYLKYKNQQSENEIININQDDSFSQVINFTINSASIDFKMISILEKIARFVILNPNIKISVYGHTDDLGEEDYNYILSKKRVKSVVESLISYGVGKERFTKYFRGESDPLLPGKTEKDRAKNRRVEMVLENFEN